MSAFSFSLAVLTLLATPGPTNTLLAASGAYAGVRRSLKLMPAEIAGYTISIGLLSLALGPVVTAHPGLTLALKLAASLWLVFCATKLWRQARQHFDATATPVTFARVFLTTLVNPKALIFAFVIFPPAEPINLLGWLALFGMLTSAVALGWISLGAALARSAGGRLRPLWIWRSASVALVLFATILSGTAVAAAL